MKRTGTGGGLDYKYRRRSNQSSMFPGRRAEMCSVQNASKPSSVTRSIFMLCQGVSCSTQPSSDHSLTLDYKDANQKVLN